MNSTNKKISFLGIALSIITSTAAINFFPIAFAITESDIQAASKASRYINQMGAMASACSEQMNSNPSIIVDCLSVIKEFDAHMQQLFSTHGQTINSILFGNNSTQ